jgi:hypothetical protein
VGGRREIAFSISGKRGEQSRESERQEGSWKLRDYLGAAPSLRALARPRSPGLDRRKNTRRGKTTRVYLAEKITSMSFGHVPFVGIGSMSFAFPPRVRQASP